MLTMLMMMSLMLSSSFIMLKHPMSMSLILILQSLTISLITGFYSTNYWFSYILFLVMIGGVLVLFIYMTSIASNEMFKYSNMILLMLMMFMLSMMTINMMDNFLPMSEIMNNDMTMMNNNIKFQMSLNKYLNYPSSMIMMFLIIYLLVTLIAVVKITDIKSGPLRQMK